MLLRPWIIGLLTALLDPGSAPAFTNLAPACTALQFDRAFPGNKIVVMASDAHMFCRYDGWDPQLPATNFNADFTNILNAMPPPQDKVIFLGDASSTISVIPGWPLQPDWSLAIGTNELKAFVRALDTITNVPRTNILWIAGNHDQMPLEPDAEMWRVLTGMPAYQAFDLGGVRFFALNGGNYGRPSQDQQDWLRAQVAANPRTQEVAVLIHEPTFPGNVIFRGNAEMLRAAFGKWEAPWYIFAGHSHTHSYDVWSVGRTNVAEIVTGTLNTNVFNGQLSDAGFRFVCLSNGYAGSIYYSFKTESYDLEPPLDWAHPKPVYGPFETVEGVLWRRLKSYTAFPEIVKTNCTDSLDWLIYPTDIQLSLPLNLHSNQATHFLLLGGPYSRDGRFSFGEDGTNWTEVAIPAPSNSVYSVPIPAQLAVKPRILFRLTDNGASDSVVAGWGLATTNPGPRITYPQLQPFTGVETMAGRPVTVTAHAIDPYAPPDVPVFSLLSAPAGAAIDRSTGVFTWTPSVGFAQTAISNVPVTIKVSDGYALEMAATQTLWITVRRPELPKLSRLSRGANGWEFQVSGEPGLTLCIEASTNLVHWQALLVTNSTKNMFYFCDPNPGAASRFYRVSMF